MDAKTEKINDDTCKLYIGGVNTEWNSDRVKEILEEHSGCDVMRVDVVKNFAFAFVDSKETGEKVIEKVHGKVIEDCKIVIQISKNKQNLPDSEDLCFECGKPGHWAKECEKRRARMSTRRGYSRPMGHGPPPNRGHDPYYGERRYQPPDSRERDPYARVYNMDPYTRDYYARDPYYRDLYARDPYAYAAPSRYTYDYGRYDGADAYAPRAATSREAIYTAERERLAYGRSAYTAAPAARSYEPASVSNVAKAPAVAERDPYASVSQRQVDPYESVRRPDPYDTTTAPRSAYPAATYPVASYSATSYSATSYSATSYDAYSTAVAPLPRSMDPYDRTDRYACEPVPKRFPEPAYAPRAK